MVDQIIDGTVEKLHETFGDAYKYYTEQVKQGLTQPCFLISCLTMGRAQQLGDRYRRDNLFSITYHPGSATDARSECVAIQEALFDALEYITVNNGLVRGTGVTGRMSNGVLVCTVNYDMFVYRVEEIEPMETLQVVAGKG